MNFPAVESVALGASMGGNAVVLEGAGSFSLIRRCEEVKLRHWQEIHARESILIIPATLERELRAKSILVVVKVAIEH